MKTIKILRCYEASHHTRRQATRLQANEALTWTTIIIILKDKLVNSKILKASKAYARVSLGSTLMAR